MFSQQKNDGCKQYLIDTTIVKTSLNVSKTDATLTDAGTIPASTTTILPVENGADETTRRTLFGAALYQSGSALGTTSNPVAVSTPPSVPSLLTQGVMPNKFDGKCFKTWQKKILFFLTKMKLENSSRRTIPLSLT